jgi:3-hydroxyisobutyrate dehydrogenase
VTAVALLGTGTMGAGMARNIARAGLTLRVWNRNAERAQPLADEGAVVCHSAAEAVKDADVVVTVLWDADSVAHVLADLKGAVRPGAVLLQCTTVGVEGCERLDALAEQLGLVHVDAPVLGTKEPAENGALVVLASGPQSARSVVAPVLDAIGQRTMWVGEAGAGSRLKLAANAFVISLVAGIAQSLAVTRELGLDPELFLQAVAGGAMDAPYVQLKGKAMIAGDFTPSFGLDGALKDADLISAAADQAGVPTELVDVLRHELRVVSGSGHGDDDLAAVYLAFSRRADER